MKPTTRLQQLFRSESIFTIAGAPNAIMARIVESAGYECTYLGGAAISGSVYGVPDVGLITRSEMTDNARLIAEAVAIPVIADADHGYGGPVAVRRTVHSFIRAGVAGIHLEDQPLTKRSGSLKGKEVIPIDEAVQKYRAAVAARDELDPDFVIIARCDARGVRDGSIEEVVRRLNAYKAAGVDVLYAEMLPTRDEIAAVRAAVEGPLMGTLRFLDPPPSLEELSKLGFAAAFYPGLTTWPAIQAAAEYAFDFRARGVAAQLDWSQRTWRYPFDIPDFNDLAGLPDAMDWEERFSVDDVATKYAGGLGLDPHWRREPDAS